MQDLILNFIQSSSTISLIVLCWLFLYFLLTFWVFLYRYFALLSFYRQENQSLKSLVSDELTYPQSMTLIQGIIGENLNREIIHIWKNQILQRASKGLTLFGIIASTAPFIGLFGTVTEILEAFSQLGGGQVSFDIVAPIISKALIATAAGILTAIPAYSFHLILKRKLYDLSIVLQMESDYMISRQDLQQQIRF